VKNKLALVVAVVLGLIAVYGMHTYINKVETKVQESNRTVAVAVAKGYVRAGTIIQPAMLKPEGKEISETAVTADHVPVTDQSRLLVGQIINRSVEAEEPILVSYVRQPVEKLDVRLEPGDRAISLRVDAITGVAGNLAPGARVDVIGTFPVSASAPAAARPAGGGGAASNNTMLLLPNVKIIAVDSRVRDEDYAAVTGTRSRNYGSVTVAVTPTEATALVYAQQLGTLTLALRPPADTTTGGMQEVNEKNLFDVVNRMQADREKRMKDRGPIESLIRQPPASGKP
jgi:pilus assembly protein CpaB